LYSMGEFFFELYMRWPCLGSWVWKILRPWLIFFLDFGASVFVNEPRICACSWKELYQIGCLSIFWILAVQY
jgi:hypothetical protein